MPTREEITKWFNVREPAVDPDAEAKAAFWSYIKTVWPNNTLSLEEAWRAETDASRKGWRAVATQQEKHK